MLLVATAAFVGLVDSLAPGHWLPVVLMAKGQRWPLRTAVLGALTAASGHVLISSGLGLLSIPIGAQFFLKSESTIERYSGLGLAVFGIAFAAYGYFGHSHCHEHSHGVTVPGAKPGSAKPRAPFYFLFMLGFSPCVAVLPVFCAASAMGAMVTILSMIAFSIGVSSALVGSTVLTSLGIMKLDHPIFEHYGEVLTGAGIAAMGVVLFILGS